MSNVQVQLGGQAVQVQVQSSGFARANAAVTLAAASAAAAAVDADEAAASAASAAATLAGAALKANNLSDLANAATARTNLGLDIGTNVQAHSANLEEYAGVNPTAAGLALLDDADASAQRTTLGLAIGTDVQAYDADLTAIAGLTSAADKMPYATGAGTWAMADLSSFARTLNATANNAAFLAALGQIDVVETDFLQAGTGAATRTGRDKLRDIVSVKDFGAVGDGTDETAEIQAALDAVDALGGGVVLIPPSTTAGYGFTNLVVGDHTTIVGQGNTEFDNMPPGGSLPPSGYLKRVGGTGVGILISGDNSGLERLHVNGALLGGDLVQVTGTRPKLRDVSLANAGRDALRIGSDDTANEFNTNVWHVSNLIIRSAVRYGLYAHDAKATTLPDVNAGVLLGCDISDCGNHAIYFEQAWDCHLYGVVCQSNGGTGVRLGALCDTITVTWPYLEANANNELVLDSGATSCVVMGNRSGTASAGYVNNSGNTTNVLFLFQPSWPGMLWNDQLGILNKTASGEARLNLLAGAGEDLVGTLVGVEGAGVGSDGEVYIEVKRAGNTPVPRIRFTDGAVVVPTGTDLQADKLSDQSGVQLVGARVTGFGAMTGTATKTAIATYTAPDIEATYTEATIQALADAVQALSRRVKAQDDALLAHGLIGA